MTAAMLRPTGLLPFAQRFPDRVYDVGIAEQHAVASAAGLAFGGLHPVVAIYATFMNRAFDQVMMDVALHRAGVTFVLDRAGVTGPDGPSHHGIWDLAMLQIVPHIRIAVPRDAERLREELREAVAVDDAPTVIRFPKGASAPTLPALERLADGVDVLVRSDAQDVLIVGIGPMAHIAVDVAERLRAQGIGATVVDPRWVVPVQPSIVELAASHRLVITIEDGIRVGGIGTRVRQVLREAGVDTAVDELGLPDEFIDHATREQILEDAGLTPAKIAQDVVVAGARHAHPGRPPDASGIRDGSTGVTAPARRSPRRLTDASPTGCRRESACPRDEDMRSRRRAARLAADALDHRVVERVAEDALRRPLAIEVGRRAAVDERPAGAEDEAQVDVLDLGDDALVEHDLDLLREPVLHAAEDLGLGRGRSSRRRP